MNQVVELMNPTHRQEKSTNLMHDYKFFTFCLIIFVTYFFLVPGQAMSDCDPEPVIVNQFPRMDSGWSGSVAWYNGNIYEVTDTSTVALIMNPVSGDPVGSIPLGSWVINPKDGKPGAKGITYDPFRGTFWVNVYRTAFEIQVTGGEAISSFPLDNYYSYGIWKDPDEANSMWVADPVDAHVVKVDVRDGSILKIINTSFNVRGVSRVENTLWCVYGGEIGEAGILLQIDMSGKELCRYILPQAPYDHDAGGCDIDPDGYLWVEGGKGTAIYQIDIGYSPAPPTPVPIPTPVYSSMPIVYSGDYNGDGTSDIAIFRDSSGLWAVRGITRVYYGRNGDIPAPGDYDGDGTTDITIFRPSTGLWSVWGLGRAYFGAPGDQPAPADYTGDGTYSGAIFRPTTGLWAVRGVTRAYFGKSGDVPLPADYTGEDKANIAIFRPTTGLWAVRSFSRAYFGQSGDIPIPAIYKGVDWTPAIFRPSTGLWALMGGPRYYFGQSTDTPVPAHYEGINVAQIGVFRSATGLWAIRGATRVYFGRLGDIPVTR